MEALDTLKSFLEDEKAWEMYITGKAGTGKTTTLKHIVEHCIANNINYIVCAFTHKACGVLETKLPPGAIITTLHSYLNKRPGINEHANHKKHVNITMRMSESERPDLVIIDEFSMVGENDYMDLVEMQDPFDETQSKFIKTLYVGDPYQLPPVGDMQTITPKKPYWVELNKVYRTDRDDLLEAMIAITDMIDGRDMEPLRSSEHLIRGQDLVKSYLSSTSTDKICLAWTNKAVQELNAAIAGKPLPEMGDKLFCSTLRHELVYLGVPSNINQILTPTGTLTLNTKYKTLEFLLSQTFINWIEVENTTLDEPCMLACIFGHYTYKQVLNQLTEEAVAANNKIKAQGVEDVPAWARVNNTNPLAKQRALAWRKLLAFREAVVCVDFPYAMTIHKSQGSTYEEVYLDSEDLAQCGDNNTTMYLKLFYVAISRASNLVITN